MKIKKLTTKEIVKIERKSILEILNLEIEVNICLIMAMLVQLTSQNLHQTN